MQQRLTVEELCMKLKPVFGRRMDELYLKYAMAESREEREEIEHILNALYHKNLSELLNKKVLLEPPLKEVMQGEYSLATISYADKKLYSFNLREKDWVRHVCISGMSGSGKTTFAFHIINNFMKKGKPFLIFDWKKSFRPLMLIDAEIMYFTVGNENVSNLFKININQPPEGVDAKEWINVLCDLVTESFFASYGVHKVLLETLDEAFRDFGVYNGSRNYPTWNEIKWRLESRLEKTKGRTATWLESALRIAHVLTFGNFGKTLNYKGKERLTIGELLSRKVIFELNALGNVEKKFFCEFILTYIYKLKKAKQIGINENFDNAILVDEAHNIFLKEKTHFVKESVTDVIYREMREYGTCLICLDQHISKISDTVAGNSACHVAFQQQLPQDIETISGLMQLRDRRQFFSMLPVGSAIVKLSERYNLPFLIEVDEVELRKKEVFDRDIANRMKFIFEGRALEQGKDPEFAKALIHPARELERTGQEKEQEETAKENTREREAIEVDNRKKFIENTGQIINQTGIKTDSIEELSKDEEKMKLEPVEISAELNNVQKILFEFVQKKLDIGMSIREIERVLEEHAIEGGYSIIDIFQVVNYVLRNKFSQESKEKSLERKKIYREEKNLSEGGIEKYTLKNNNVYKENNFLIGDSLTKEKEKFLDFIKENLNHNYSTIELYRKLELSARKGNKIKNELLKEGKIRIEEQRSDKGWRKIIRLNK